MAFLPPQQQDLTSPQGTTNTPQGTGTPPPQTGGSSGTGSGASKAGAPQSAGTPTQFGSSASKLGDYLSANAPQIGQQANAVTNNLNSQYNQIGSDINNAIGQFGQQVQGGYAAPNQSLVDQAVANPTGFAATPGNVAGFQSQYNDTYTGPQNFESTTPYSNIQGEVSNAVQNAGLLNTQAGIQNYLRGTAGPNQTQASNTLDALLLQGNPESQAQIQKAAGQFSGLTDQFGNAVKGADASVTAAQNAANQAQQYAQNTFNPITTQFGNNVTQGLTQAQQAQTAYNNNVNNAYSQLTPIQQWLQQYQGATGQTLTNPLTQYLNQKPVNAPTAAGVATPEQYQEAAALQQLLGMGYQSPLDQANASQAGTYKTPAANNYNLNDLIEQLGTGATTTTFNQLRPGMQNQPLNTQSFVAADNSPAYQQFINQLQSVSPDLFRNATYAGSNPNNYYLKQ